MTGALRIVRPPITGNPSSRQTSQLPTPVYIRFTGGKCKATPLLWKLRSFSRLRKIAATAEFHQDDDGEDRLPQVSSVNWTKSLTKFAANNFLPVALVSGVLLGLANPSLGCVADTYYLSKFSTFGIFIISGLTLRSNEIGAAAEAWPVGLFGLASILFITPLFSRIILLLKLQPQEFVTGLAIFCCMPTTLSSGVALTRVLFDKTQLAGGNSALALAVTVISNLFGIVIIPFSISKFIGAGVGVSVPAKKLLRSLVLTLLVPLVLGKVARELSKGETPVNVIDDAYHYKFVCFSLSSLMLGVADFADGNCKLLAVTSAIFLSLVPWIQVSRSRALLLMVKPSIFLVAVVMGILLHAVLLAFNAVVVPCLSVISGGSKSPFAKKENSSALLLVASQKTLPVTVAVVEQLRGALGESGLLVLPCVAAHLNQIIIDSFLVSFWEQKEGEFENAKVG